MHSGAVEQSKLRKPRNPTNTTSNSIPRIRASSHSSTPKPTVSFVFPSPSLDQPTKNSKKFPRKKREKFLGLITLRSFGCSAISSPASTPVLSRSASTWEVDRKQRKNEAKATLYKRRVTTAHPDAVIDIADICCAPPGIGFSSDVAPPKARADTKRTKRTTNRACKARRIAPSPALSNTTSTGTNLYTARENGRPQHRSLGVFPEITAFELCLLSRRTLDESDRFAEWRLNVDSMTYEELLELSESIGNVPTGLQEDEIFSCLRKTMHSLPISTEKDWKCSICQEVRKAEEEIGRLDCGHCHHISCIKQWLLQKNACPVCKIAAVGE